MSAAYYARSLDCLKAEVLHELCDELVQCVEELRELFASGVPDPEGIRFLEFAIHGRLDLLTAHCSCLDYGLDRLYFDEVRRHDPELARSIEDFAAAVARFSKAFHSSGPRPAWWRAFGAFRKALRKLRAHGF